MSSNGWRRCLLGDVVELQRGFDLPERLREDGDVPIVASSGINGFHSTPKVNGPGVITGRYGSIGQVFYIDRSYWPLNTTLWVKDFKGSDPRFIYYWLQIVDFESVSAKSAVPGVNRNDLHEFEVVIPRLDEQRRIAGVLGALDDKIEHNRKLVACINEIRTLLFRHHARSAPRVQLGSLVRQIRDRVGDRNVVVLSAVQSGRLVPSDEHFNKRVHSNDISRYLLVRRWSFAFNPSRANIGSIGLHRGQVDGAVSPVYVVAQAGEEWASWIEHCMETEDFRNAVSRLSSGSVRQSLSFDGFASIDVPAPEESRLAAFREQDETLRGLAEHKEDEAETLRSIRDALLPRLVSGVIRVPDSCDPRGALGMVSDAAGAAIL